MEAPVTPRVSLVSLGCRVNRAESDLMAQDLEAAGLHLSPSAEADAIVVNTCAVTGEAEAKARKAIRHAAALPQQPLVVATGCAATLFADRLAGLARNVVVVGDKKAVAGEVARRLGFEGGTPCVPSASLAVTPTGRTRPGIPVQDGCDLRCTYCIVWKARGPSRSRDVDEVLSRVRAARLRGAREIVLTGINLGRYVSRDNLGHAVTLPRLLELVLDETGIERVRLSSIEPQDVSDDLLETMAAYGGRVAPFLHICLQSGCDGTLSRMGRVYDTAFFSDAVSRARAHIPGLALGTDVIVGFPGETGAEFAESLAFCREMAFSRMHVFRYSRRPGTPAAAMEGQVAAQESAERSAAMRALSRELRLSEAKARVGTNELVLVQVPGSGVTGSLFDARLNIAAEPGMLVPVSVASVENDGTLACVALEPCD